MEMIEVLMRKHKILYFRSLLGSQSINGSQNLRTKHAETATHRSNSASNFANANASATCHNQWHGEELHSASRIAVRGKG